MTARKAVIFVIVFVSGAGVLALEILAGRFLTINFGSTIYVWGNLIAVFLAGLAIGYYAGGHLSDRHASFGVFAVLLLISAVLVGTLPLYAFRVSDIVFRHLGLGTVERVGPLLTSLVVFLLPTTVLGTVSPYAVRLLADDPSRLGRDVGTLYALSTCGSIVGALGTTFYLVLKDLDRDLYLLGAVQALLALLAFAAWLKMQPPRHSGIDKDRSEQRV